jgi:hypothetical protein
MFQQTIQDLLAIAEAGPHPEDLLDRVRSTLGAFERFECGEIAARTERGLVRFVIAPGLGELAPQLLSVLGDQPTLRIDTAAEMSERGLSPLPGLASLLLLRIDTPGAASAVLALGHSRNWSFAGSALSRIRAIGSLALRLLLRNS